MADIIAMNMTVRTFARATANVALALKSSAFPANGRDTDERGGLFVRQRPQFGHIGQQRILSTNSLSA